MCVCVYVCVCVCAISFYIFIVHMGNMDLCNQSSSSSWILTVLHGKNFEGCIHKLCGTTKLFHRSAMLIGTIDLYHCIQ